MKRLIEWVVVALAFLASINGVAAQSNRPSPLLAIDQHRATVVERIVTEWGDRLIVSGAGVTREQLREMLFAMRADHLLAASLAGTLDGLRNVLSSAVLSDTPRQDRLVRTKALGDAADDVVYTPVTPCRLVETRGTFAAVYQGGGAFGSNEIRNYTAQGGNGVCLTQLPAGLNPSALQLQVFGIPINSSANGDVEVLPQGSTFGSTATLVYLGNILFTSASTTARINLVNNQIGVQVRGGGAHVAIDVVGYFKSAGDATGLNINVNGQRVMRYEYNATGPDVIGGFVNNGVFAGVRGATIAGGGAPGASGAFVGIFECNDVYGCQNSITDHFGTIGGGAGNFAGNNNGDLTDNMFATVAGGISNSALSAAAVGGGYHNHAWGQYSTVAGGRDNSATASYGTVSGGQGNEATGVGATVGGGIGNQASGSVSTVAGGQENVAAGAASFAAGYLAHANAHGCVVFSDVSSANPTSCNFSNEFIARALGGVYFFTGGSSDATYTGAFLGPGSGAWAAYSDRNGKENFAPVDGVAVLDALAAIPISTWNWKTEAADIRHMGPMAQDFRAAFGLGPDDKHITTIDADGVALAAIQGLHRAVQEKDARIAALERTVEQLKRAVDALTAKQ
jgi:hypothetical protein